MSILNRIGWRLPKTIGKFNIGITSSSVRYLFNVHDLGTDHYEEDRKKAEHAIANPYAFKTKFRENFQDPGLTLIQLEFGLKNLLHIMKKDPDDTTLLKDALNLLVRKQAEDKITNDDNKYHFDSIIMRALHYLNMPDEAIELIEDKMLCQLFTKITALQVLFDLLYENQKYEDLIRIHGNLNKNGYLYEFKRLNVILFASYYRLNTAEAFKQSHDLYTHLTETFQKIKESQFRKSHTFMAALALKHNQPEMCLKIIEQDKKPMFVTIRHIKLLAWSKLEQFDKVIDMLRTIIELHKEKPKLKPFSSIEVLNEIECALKQKNAHKYTDEFCDIRKEIQRFGLETHETFDELICSPFPAKRENVDRRSINKWQ